MYYFELQPFSIKQLLVFAKKHKPVVSRYFKAQAVLITFSCISLAACSQIVTQKKIGHNLIKTPASVEKPAQVSNGANKPVELTGLWKIGYRYQGKSDIGSMQIRQNDSRFIGQGKDEQSGATFKIEHGLIKGNEILFLKKYDNSPGPPVQYHGQFSYLPTNEGEVPYMGGDFSFEVNGAVNIGEWEAALANSSAVKPQNNKKPAAEEPKEVVVQPHCPDLSGKWNVAYEYNFQIVHSTMFLEQYGHKISGHGTDTDTKEKFIIKHGWYDFPHFTIIKEYPAKSGINKLITFKADVSEVVDKDYTGPYLSGKTQGGGTWEAERVN